MSSETDDLALKLENYVLQLRQVEAALAVDPAHVELLKIKADLNELIELTKSLLTAKVNEGIPVARKAKLSSESSTTAQQSTESEDIAGSWKNPSENDEYVDKIVSRIQTFDDDSYRDFLFKVLDESRPPEIIRSIVKRYINRGRKSIKRHSGARDADINGCNGSADPSSNGRESSNPAWKAPLIYRGEMIPSQDGLLFMIVKKIRLKPNIYRGHEFVPAVVCIVNSQKSLVFWSLINWKEDEICETFPKTTGITPASLVIGLPLNEVSCPPSPEDDNANETANSIIESCSVEMQSELKTLKISLQPDDMRHCAMLHYWRKVLAEMRRPDTLDRVLPAKTMAKLSQLRNVTEAEVEAIMQKDKCINSYNNDQIGMMLNILNKGERAFKKMVTCLCHRCGGRGHVARICTRLKNVKAVISKVSTVDNDRTKSLKVNDHTECAAPTEKEDPTKKTECESSSLTPVTSTTTASCSKRSISPSSSMSTNSDMDSAEKDEESALSPLSVVAYDKDGNRFTLGDYMNRKVTDKKLMNYFAKHKKRLNQMCINDHRVMHGLEPLTFRRNRGVKKYRHSEFSNRNNDTLNNPN